MSKKRKYARYGEKGEGYECTNSKCKWQGLDKDKIEIPHEVGYELVCPKCHNNEFYQLLEYNVA